MPVGRATISVEVFHYFMNLLSELRLRFRSALESLDPSAADLAELVLPSQDAKFGDYQANCAMPLGKRLGKPPREVAQQLVDRLAADKTLDDFCDPPTIAGPGFINLRVKDHWLAGQLQSAVADQERLGVRPVEHPRTCVVDFSSPNVAKPMHVGHIRSTVIGDALCRVLRFLGHRTISDNHIGDWGTQFGMIIYGLTHFCDGDKTGDLCVEEICQKYQLVNQLIEYHDTRNRKIPDVQQQLAKQEQYVEQLSTATLPVDPKEQKREAKRLRQAERQLADLRTELRDLEKKLAGVEDDPALSELARRHAEIGSAVLAETAKLHAGDAANLDLWNRIMPICLKEINETYDRLGVTFDHALGESFYQDRLADVVASLTEKGLARESDGAMCVFLDGHEAPFIVQKQDGAFLYATTDLATIQYRMQEWSPDAILYVVDHRQSFHFEQLIATARLWEFPDVELEHIRFGTVLGEDGRPYKTRSGTAVGLTGLLDEAVERAHKIVCKNDDSRQAPLLSGDERQNVAERIGIGAIKYADLAHNRTSDYEFSYDKMLAMTGNTAAYMQYSYARVSSIFARGGVDIGLLRQSKTPIVLDSPAERGLAMALLQFGEALERVADDYRPNHLTTYLFHLASKYSEFFEHCPVLKAETDAQRNSRLFLCDLTARTIERGLNLLGIEVVERM